MLFLCTRRYRHLRSFFIFLLVTVLLFMLFAQPVNAEAIVITSAMVAFTMMVLGVLGVTFTYATKDAAISGVTGMITGFLADNPAIPLSLIFPPAVLAEFVLSGKLSFHAGHVWNEFVDWIKGDVAEASKVINAGGGNYIIDGITLYKATETQVLNMYGSASKYLLPASSELFQAHYPFASNGNIRFYVVSTYDIMYYAFSYWTTGNWGNVYLSPFSPYYIIFAYQGDFTSAYAYAFTMDGEYVNRFAAIGTIREWFKSIVGTAVGAPPLDIPLDDIDIDVPEEDNPDLVYAPPLPGFWTDVKDGVMDKILQDIIEGIGTGAISVPGLDTLTKNPAIPGVDDPAIPGEIVDDTTLQWSDAAPEDFKIPKLTNFFPFCVPFDLIALIEALNAKAVAPVFRIPVDMSFAGYEGEIVVDLREFEELTAVVRWGMTIFYILGLTIITRKVIKG